jgi:hypothetical protein
MLKESDLNTSLAHLIPPLGVQSKPPAIKDGTPVGEYLMHFSKDFQSNPPAIESFAVSKGNEEVSLSMTVSSSLMRIIQFLLPSNAGIKGKVTENGTVVISCSTSESIFYKIIHSIEVGLYFLKLQEAMKAAEQNGRLQSTSIEKVTEYYNSLFKYSSALVHSGSNMDEFYGVITKFHCYLDKEVNKLTVSFLELNISLMNLAIEIKYLKGGALDKAYPDLIKSFHDLYQGLMTYSNSKAKSKDIISMMTSFADEVTKILVKIFQVLILWKCSNSKDSAKDSSQDIISMITSFADEVAKIRINPKRPQTENKESAQKLNKLFCKFLVSKGFSGEKTPKNLAHLDATKNNVVKNIENMGETVQRAVATGIRL